MIKVLLYFKQIMLLLTGNKLRFILTFIGTFIGIFIFSAGNIVMDSYYYSRTKEVRVMSDSSFFVITNEDRGDIMEKLYFLHSVNPVIERISATDYAIYEKNLEGDGRLIVYARMHGVSEMSDNVLINSQEYGINMAEIKIVNGRVLTKSEIVSNEQVCVIDEYTEKILFGEGKGIGNYIYFNMYNGGVSALEEKNSDIVSYEVVGIMENTYYTKDEFYGEEKYNGNKNPQKFAFVNIICPYDYYKNINEQYNNYVNIGFLWNCRNRDEKEKLINESKNTFMLLGNQYEISEIVDNEYKYEILREKLQPVKIGINVGTLVLLTISGISCMSIIFFTMKERINEIGIKKAFGASCMDIVFQFWLENIIIFLLSVTAAVICSIFVVSLGTEYIKLNFLDDYELHITIKNILLPASLGILQGIFFTIIPSIRYSVINVTKALRLES